MVDRDFYWIYIYIILYIYIYYIIYYIYIILYIYIFILKKKKVCIYIWDVTNQYMDNDGNNGD